jgi:hypothetical protein
MIPKRFFDNTPRARPLKSISPQRHAAGLRAAREHIAMFSHDDERDQRCDESLSDDATSVSPPADARDTARGLPLLAAISQAPVVAAPPVAPLVASALRLHMDPPLGRLGH